MATSLDGTVISKPVLQVSGMGTPVPLPERRIDVTHEIGGARGVLNSFRALSRGNKIACTVFRVDVCVGHPVFIATCILGGVCGGVTGVAVGGGLTRIPATGIAPGSILYPPVGGRCVKRLPRCTDVPDVVGVSHRPDGALRGMDDGDGRYKLYST
ncbi:MAG: hypothetical protein OXF02_03400 [Simkaniaceae bacterium]|nr:hypothetical protein [Simkaniaceae bacterium]